MHKMQTIDISNNKYIASAYNIKYGIIAFILFIILAVIGVFFLVDYERNRDIIIWQNKLNSSVDNDQHKIEQWIDARLIGLGDLAANQTLQLYLSRWLEDNSNRHAMAYIRELLILKAAELGVYQDSSGRIIPLAANINTNTHNNEGLALLNKQGELLASSLGGIELSNDFKDVIKNALGTGKHKVVELLDFDNHLAKLGFIVPVYPVQVDPLQNADKAIAVLIAVVNPTSAINAIAKESVYWPDDEEMLLIKRHNNNVLYLSQVKDGALPLTKTISLNTENSADVIALTSPEQFASAFDYRGQEVFFNSRPLKYLPWLVMHKITKTKALADSIAHANFLYSLFACVVLVILILLISAWRFGTDSKYRHTVNKLLLTNDALSARNKMLELITDNVSDYIMLIDQHNKLAFGNKAIASISGELDSNIAGKNLASVIGGNTAKQITGKLQGLNHETAFKQKLLINDQEKTFHTVMSPVKGDDDQMLSMVVAHDVSGMMAIEKQKEKMMELAVAMLSKILAQHDPYSAQHSFIVRRVAIAIGSEMNFSETELSYLGIAANLLNVGKFYVPVDLLVKHEVLTGQELQIIRGHIFYTIKMLKDISIDEQIVLTVSQSCEKFDGSGYPNGLVGNEICKSARILSVANAYVAMTCPRAWRGAMSQTEAMNTLMQDPGYDKKISIVLYNLIENNGGLDLNLEGRGKNRDSD